MLLSLAVWATNLAIAQVILALTGRAPRRGVTYAGGLFALVAILITLLPAAPTPAGPTLKVASFQVGFDLYGGLWNERRLQGDNEAISQDLFALGAEYSRAAAVQGACLVVWPEGFLRIVPQDDPAWKERVEGLARETDLLLAIGYVTETPDGRRNEVALVTPSGEWHVTGKDHPVPWAETGSVTRGQVAVAQVDGYRVGSIICYDADFTDTARERAAEGLHLLVAPAHDWVAIGRSRLLHVRARAAENRLPIVMADWMVGSGMVDATGGIVAGAPTDHQTDGLVVADLPLGTTQPTPYTRAGDLVGWGSIGVMILGIFLTKRRRAGA